MSIIFSIWIKPSKDSIGIPTTDEIESIDAFNWLTIYNDTSSKNDWNVYSPLAERTEMNDRCFHLGPMTVEESRALILEEIPKFEDLTNLILTETDLRIVSMERFASIERRMDRSLLTSEYRHLLQTELPIDYIERELLRRPLTIDERHEQEEFASLRHEYLAPDPSPRLQRVRWFSVNAGQTNFTVEWM